MQLLILKRISLLVVAAAAVLAVACGDSGSTPAQPLGVVVPPGTGAANGGGTDSTPTPPAPPDQTSNGPVDHVVLNASAPTLPRGYYLGLSAIAFDAQGVPVRTVTTAWHSSDPNVATVADTGLVYAKNLGVATITATIDGHVASSVVTVVEAPAPPVPTPPQPPVASFDLTVTVRGALAGTDTSQVELVAGALVTLTQVGGITGDTLLASLDAGHATTDANGVATFRNLPGGYYTIDVVPPAGSPYTPARTGIGAPDVTDVHTSVKLARQP